MNNIFENRLEINGQTKVPVWFMRQAGRYHNHYQNIKKNSDFMTMCKDPQLACDVTMGPIEDFNFDAAILFSDLLFPLEHLGLGLEYSPGPKLARHVESLDIAKSLSPIAPANEFYNFQKEACEKLKKALSQTKTLLGFVGAPYTLYTYAVEGGHSGNLISSKKGLYDGRWDAFTDIMIPEVIKEMSVQAQGGADAICLFDTAAGELSQYDYESFVFPKIKAQIEGFKSEHPETRIVYYSKFTHTQYLTPLFDLPIDVFGVDWRHDLAETQKLLPKDRYIQGNIDPAWLHLEWNDLKANLNNYKKHLDSLDMDYSRWIFGLGHGVTIQTPEENVRNTVKWVEENLLY